MRALWDYFKQARDQRKLSFSKFLRPYQKVFELVRGYAKQLRNNVPLEPGRLFNREWLKIYNVPRERTLRVMSFNVLSQSLNEQFSFQFVVIPEGAGDFLEWNHRKDMLIREINRHKPDIVCLQEVEIQQKDELMEGLEGLAEAAFCN